MPRSLGTNLVSRDGNYSRVEIRWRCWEGRDMWEGEDKLDGGRG